MKKNNMGEFTVENSGDNNSGAVVGIVMGDMHLYPQKEITKIPALITELVEILANLDDLYDEEKLNEYVVKKSSIIEYKIEDKMDYNQIIKFKDIFDDYSIYGGICDRALNILSDNKLFGKRKILNNINGIYKKLKGKLRDKYKCNNNKDLLNIIKENSDNAIEYVREELLNRILNDVNSTKMYNEDIEFALDIIVCYGFIECKILERPK